MSKKKAVKTKKLKKVEVWQEVEEDLKPGEEVEKTVLSGGMRTSPRPVKALSDCSKRMEIVPSESAVDPAVNLTVKDKIREGLLQKNPLPPMLTLEQALQKIEEDNRLLDGVPDEVDSVEAFAQKSQFEVQDLQPELPTPTGEEDPAAAAIAAEEASNLENAQNSPEDALQSTLPIYQDGKIVGYQAASESQSE
jgi:hypothetical protein